MQDYKKSIYVQIYVCIVDFVNTIIYYQTKERKEKSTVSLMKRLASMKRSKSPPSSTYSMDNPVFEDTSIQPVKSPGHPVHVRYEKNVLHGFLCSSETI